MPENEHKEIIDEAELRRLTGDARERAGLSREAPPAAKKVGEIYGRPVRVVGAHNPASEAEREAMGRARLAERRLERVRRAVPARYGNLTLSSPELAKRVQAASAFAAVRAALDGAGMTFTGRSGSGTTSLACAAMATFVLERGGSCMFVPARDLAAARASHALGDGEPPLVERAMHDDLVIIDDLGIEESATRSAVGDVIDERYDRELVTWVTTGFEVSAIATRYGAGRARRIFEHPVAIIGCGSAR